MSMDYALVCNKHKELVLICSDGLSGPLLQCDRSLAAFVITHRTCVLAVVDETDEYECEYVEWTSGNWEDKLKY